MATTAAERDTSSEETYKGESARAQQLKCSVSTVCVYSSVVAVGRVNPKHLDRAETWDVKVGGSKKMSARRLTGSVSIRQYLGCIPDVEDWQTPNTRTEFMELIDGGQIDGHLMWSSANIKSLHISTGWLVISDKSKKVCL